MSKIELLPEVHADDSGNTGEDLLSSAQPVFALGSVFLSGEEAAGILAKAGLESYRDWKFRRLRGSNQGRKNILSVLGQLTPETAKGVLSHKQFTVVAKLVDDLLEPVLKDHGIDLYDRGGQYVIANVWFHALPLALGEAETGRFFSAFITMYRDRTPVATTDFYDALDRAIAMTVEPVRSDLTLLAESRDLVEQSLSSSLPADVLDPQAHLPIVLLSQWGNQLQEPFRFIHDHSKAMEAFAPHLTPFLFSPAAPTTIGYGERSITVPLLAVDIAFADSKEAAQIQIADLLAGAFAFLANTHFEPTSDERFLQSLQELGLGRLLVHAVWPDIDAQLDDADARGLAGVDPATAAAMFVRDWRENR